MRKAGRLNFEADALKLKEAESQGKGEDVRKAGKTRREEMEEMEEMQEMEEMEDLDSVHDDVSKLRKVQKSMEMKKKKGQARCTAAHSVVQSVAMLEILLSLDQERWEAKKESDKKKVEEQQAQRKENLQNRGTKKKAKMQQRMGFEGEKTGFLNSGPY
eukprot:Skav206869  [mRNA]  locus=scaffold898:103622:107107:- [translate_table: standard]